MTLKDTGSAKARTRCSWSAEEKAEWLRLLEESGKPLSEFCRANGLPGSSVALWRRQRREPAAGPNEPEFVELTLPAVPRSGPAVSAVTIRVGCDLAIEMPVGTDPAWLAEVVRHLRREP